MHYILRYTNIKRFGDLNYVAPTLYPDHRFDIIKIFDIIFKLNMEIRQRVYGNR